MRLVLRIMGLDVLDLELTTAEPEPEDTARDLSGGATGSTEVGVGFTRTWLGETGME